MGPLPNVQSPTAWHNNMEPKHLVETIPSETTPLEVYVESVQILKHVECHDGSFYNVYEPKEEPTDADQVDIVSSAMESASESNSDCGVFCQIAPPCVGSTQHQENDSTEALNNTPKEKVRFIKTFQCFHCSKIFSERRGLLKHQRNDTGDSTFKCYLCPMMFTNKNCHSHHQNEMHFSGIRKSASALPSLQRPYESFQFKCGDCMRRFIDQQSLDAHQLKVHAQSQCCRQCPETFSQGSALKEHELEMHSNQQQNVSVLKNSTSSSVESHKFPHILKPFKCLNCFKAFSQRKKLICHQQHDTGESTFKCILCPLSFSNKKCHFHHQSVVHLGVNANNSTAIYTYNISHPFKCDECERRFCTTDKLMHHKNKMHLRVRMHQCDECPKAFLRKDNMLAHKKRHRNERPHKCLKCSCSFTDDWKLVDHESRVHSDAGNKFDCIFCPKHFVTQSNLNFHVKRAHSHESKKSNLKREDLDKH